MTKTILVVDDDEYTRQQFDGTRHLFDVCYLDILKHLGLDARFITAENCEQAREKLKCGDIDVLIADIRLPDGSGIDLLKEALAIKPTMKVLICSGVDISTTENECKGLPIPILRKPYGAEQFVDAVNTLLNEETAEQDGRKKTVLIVEDAEAMAEIVWPEKIIPRLKEHQGLENAWFLLAKGYYDALKQLEQNNVDVLITDLWLDPLTGHDSGLKLIKESLTVNPKTKYILVSGIILGLDETAALKNMRLTDVPLLEKPHETKDLPKFIERLADALNNTLKKTDKQLTVENIEEMRFLEELPHPGRFILADGAEKEQIKRAKEKYRQFIEMVDAKRAFMKEATEEEYLPGSVFDLVAKRCARIADAYEKEIKRQTKNAEQPRIDIAAELKKMNPVAVVSTEKEEFRGGSKFITRVGDIEIVERRRQKPSVKRVLH